MHLDLTWLWVISLKISHYWENLPSIKFLYYGEKLFTTLVGSPLKSFVLLRGEVELAFEESHFILDLSLWSTLYPVGIPCGKSLIVHGSPKKIFPRGTLPWRIIYLGDRSSDVFFILASSRQGLVTPTAQSDLCSWCNYTNWLHKENIGGCWYNMWGAVA